MWLTYSNLLKDIEGEAKRRKRGSPDPSVASLNSNDIPRPEISDGTELFDPR